MENASKALIMAAEVLIGVMIITIGVAIFRNSAELAKNYENSQERTSLQTFNKKFEIYQKMGIITIQDIVSAANLARQINEENDVNHSSDLCIHIIYTDDNYSNEHLDDVKKWKTSDFYKLMQDNSLYPGTDEKVKYVCEEIKYNDVTNVVSQLKFKKVK